MLGINHVNFECLCYYKTLKYENNIHVNFVAMLTAAASAAVPADEILKLTVSSREIDVPRSVLMANGHFRASLFANASLKKLAIPVDSPGAYDGLLKVYSRFPFASALSFSAALKLIEFLTLKKQGGSFNGRAFFQKYSEFPDILLSVADSVGCISFVRVEKFLLKGVLSGEKNLFDQCLARMKLGLPLNKLNPAVPSAELDEAVRRILSVLNLRLGQLEAEMHER